MSDYTEDCSRESGRILEMIAFLTHLYYLLHG